MTSLHIVVAATIATSPRQAGWTWAVLQYLLGFRELGHRVTFIDPIDPGALQPVGAPVNLTRNAASFLDIVGKYGMGDDSVLLVSDENHETIGMDYHAIRQRVRETDLLLNVSGKLRDGDLIASAPRSLYLDVDPAFTQLWQEVQGIDMGLEGHSHFATVGPRIGRGSLVPALGKEWIATWPPVVLPHWPVAEAIRHDALTTVANWRGYGSIEYQGRFFGQKAHTLRTLIDLPRRTSEGFVLALGIDPGERTDVSALAAHGWQLVDPLTVTGTPDDYRAFIQGSKAEFGIAKAGYVVSQCGWFSDRSVCYLASGRPVIAHDTGFEDLPTGEGLLPFTTVDDVLAAIDAMNSDYPKHARAAREIAETHFDSRRVLTRLLSEVGA